MKAWILGMGVAVGLGTAGATHAETACVPASENEIQQVRETFKLELFDSDSAKFADVCKRTLTKGRKKPTVTYCGLVNAKNRYGAYVGFSEFYSVPQTGGAGFAEDNSSPGIKKLNWAYCATCMMPEKSVDECFELARKSIRSN